MDMLKRFLYLLLFEGALLGVGLLTFPDFVTQNPHYVIAIFAIPLFLLMTLDHLPSGFVRLQAWRWLGLEDGGRYYRDLLSTMGETDGVRMFDSMASPHPSQPSKRPVASAFRWIVQEAINEGRMEVWGVPENGSKPVRLLKVDDDATAYRKFKEGDSEFLMMEGVYFRDLEIKRSTIKSYAEHVRAHDAELKRRAGKNLTN